MVVTLDPRCMTELDGVRLAAHIPVARYDDFTRGANTAGIRERFRPLLDGIRTHRLAQEVADFCPPRFLSVMGAVGQKNADTCPRVVTCP